MDKELKYELRFSEAVEKVILELVLKHGLRRDLTMDISKIMKIKNPKFVIFNLAKKIVNKEGRFKDISETLKKELKMHQKNAENLAHDIKDKVIPLVTIVKEEPVEELETPERISAEEIILEKIAKGALQKTPIETDEALTSIKKAEIEDVEKNAEKIKEAKKFAEKQPIEERDEENVKKFGENKFQEEKKGSDKYREAVE